MPARSIPTPLGALIVTEDAGAITRLHWRGAAGPVTAKDDTPLLNRAEAQLLAYFAGERGDFDLPVRIAGSAAQQAVCAAMQAIPCGETRTYGDLARALGLSAQAVGQLCGGNPVPVIVPCHRVLGAAGLGGFSAPGGVETKVWLLRHERAGGLLI
ncbi:MAG: methylated-DNA--[protein]-cysteine S-methyltransferase [Rhodobacter sp.]|uniref:methylated-DNA--[protein]-cysteine S-methyltransferase n=1 Tax=Pararhodobacter sp. TaxID=2127056 RepID=UPI001DB62C55|nr:methylated-DNA--[protein]-cysteine S-methyltransferase [Pararhodobacter sp.]MCB1345391.1 methylated-DNA--[protein]-cysteine S-methyltransferase [Paracoccaceae bacterium]MCB1408656.1 methylated-DNA--[protein]-cysteine S-methyltransferase [Paracoccaceae bacterium]MCC0073034.1 methylated-DNA--[protein]-cysteine S-methyltransferase [Rhodobacter sp.]HPD91969.1 methylated-DNA--[protein]-cysteine S-methyltransferase [Pararhodobacter sp.]